MNVYRGLIYNQVVHWLHFFSCSKAKSGICSRRSAGNSLSPLLIYFPEGNWCTSTKVWLSLPEGGWSTIMVSVITIMLYISRYLFSCWDGWKEKNLDHQNWADRRLNQGHVMNQNNAIPMVMHRGVPLYPNISFIPVRCF